MNQTIPLRLLFDMIQYHIKRHVICGAILAVLGILIVGAPGDTAYAAIDSARFQSGRIIDDGVFYNKDSMSINDIQSFLNNNVPACDTWGVKPSGHGNTRAEYNISIGRPGPPYVCLQNYQENPATGETSFEKGGAAFSGGISSAQIIYDASQQYGINPQVLLVFLKKEQGSLFYDDWPIKSQYKYAMGYACPDSGPKNSANCDSAQGGFYKQVNLAAYQLRRYQTNISEYNYQPNRVNYIQYSPNASCGGSNVYIENIATASLYIYTPYQPTPAALNAYPGTVSCGAYGNRNFWYYFQEWFGNTLQSDIVRTHSDGTLYLLADNKKYHIPSMEVLNRLQPISQTISYVTQQYIDTFETGQPVKTALRNPDTGAIYLIDSGYKLQFYSCGAVSDYGLDCASIPNATSGQLSRYVTGPSVTNLFKRLEDEKLYYIDEGKRHEAFDAQAMQQAGISGHINRLSFSAISSLDIGEPIVRDNVLIHDYTSGAIYFYDKLHGASYIDSEIYGLKMFNTLPMASLSRESIQRLPKTASVTGIVQDGSGQRYALGLNIKLPISVAGEFRELSQSVLSKHTTVFPQLIKPLGSDKIYYLSQNSKAYHILRWSDVTHIDSSASIKTVLNSAIRRLGVSNITYYRPLTLIKTDNDSRVYLVDEATQSKKSLGSFSTSSAIGAGTNVVVVGDETLDGYITNGSVSEFVNCQGDLYIASQGTLQYMSGSRLAEYGLPGDSFEVYSRAACEQLDKGGLIGNFVIGTNGRIYQINGGQKHYVSSMGVYTALGGNSSNTTPLSSAVLSKIPTGNNV